MKLARVLLVFVLACGWFTRVAHAAASTPVPSKSLSSLIEPDGTLDLHAGLNGALDISGYSVQLDPQRGPLFSPQADGADVSSQAIAGFGKWAGVGDGGGVLDGVVKGVAVHGTDLYVVGSFLDAGNIPQADYVARWDGSSWSALGDDSFNDGVIDFYLYSVAVDSNGDVYVGGDFSNIRDNGTLISAAGRIAKWDGSSWSALGNNGSGGPSLNGGVYAIAIDSSDNLYVGGNFTDVNNGGTVLTAADYVAKWDGANWSALGSDGLSNGSINSYVRAIALDAANNVYVGGFFTNVNNGGSVLDAADYVAEWSGSAWSALGDNGSGGGALNSYVYAIGVDGGNDVYAGGSFTNAHDGSTTLTAADHVARWDGTHWSALGSNGSSNGSISGTVYALLISGTDVYAGGYFTDVNNGGSVLTAGDRVAKWDGASWSSLGSNGASDGAIPAEGDGGVFALGLRGSSLIVAGSFYDVSDNGTTLPQADYLSQWNGTDWSSVGSDTNGALATGYASSQVYAIAVSGTDVYVGGSFYNISNHGINLPEGDYIARWDGQNWSALGSDGAGDGVLNGDVRALAVDGAGNLYAGGIFNNVTEDGVYLPEIRYVAKWDGAHWSALGNDGAGHSSLNGYVDALAVSGSDLYVGGGFTDVNNGNTLLGEADYIARWDGSNWNALGSNGGGDGSINGWVDAIAVSGTDVYVGGGFTDVNNNGAPLPEADYIAKWDGSNWSALGSDGASNGSLNSFVSAIAISGTDLYAGGNFTDANNGGMSLTAADYIARWDGTNWSALGEGCAGNGAVNGRITSIAVDVTGVYAGGYFDNVKNPDGLGGCPAVTEADRVARWNGSSWSALGGNGAGDGALPSRSLNYMVDALIVSGTDLLVGGSFSNPVSNGTAVKTADYLAAYGMQATVRLASQGANDGWIPETGENTGLGGLPNSTATTLRLGDDAARRQYRSILSFKSGPSIPDNAIITSVTLVLRKQSITGGGNPVTMFGGLMADVRSGFFGSASTLQSADFKAGGAMLTGPFNPSLSSGAYTINLLAAQSKINRLSGLTQIRLRFKMDDNNNGVANYLSLYSGNASSALRPKLIITYYLP